MDGCESCLTAYVCRLFFGSFAANYELKSWCLCPVTCALQGTNKMGPQHVSWAKAMPFSVRPAWGLIILFSCPTCKRAVSWRVVAQAQTRRASRIYPGIQSIIFYFASSLRSALRARQLSYHVVWRYMQPNFHYYHHELHVIMPSWIVLHLMKNIVTSCLFFYFFLASEASVFLTSFLWSRF